MGSALQFQMGCRGVAMRDGFRAINHSKVHTSFHKPPPKYEAGPLEGVRTSR